MNTPNRKTVKIDRKHTVKLLAGEPVTIKVPAGVNELTLQCAAVLSAGERPSLAHVIDVFFNGRPARA